DLLDHGGAVGQVGHEVVVHHVHVHAVGAGDLVQLGADAHEVGIEDAGVDVVAVGRVRGGHAVGAPSVEGAGCLRSRWMYMASVPWTWGHSCTAGPAPRSTSSRSSGRSPARTASRASSSSTSARPFSTSATISRVSARCGEQVT